MTISERLFMIMNEKNVSMPDLSRMTGISRHTIYDWQRKNTNPGADKIMVICEALQITPEELLIGRTEEFLHTARQENTRDDTEKQIIEGCRELSEKQKKRVLAYMSMLRNMKETDIDG